MRNKREEIKISLYEVEQRIYTYSYYVGEARRNSGTPIKLSASIQASSDDHIQINDHINVAANELTKIINCNFGTCKQNVSDDETHKGYTILVFHLVPPQYFPVNLLGELQKTMTNYLVMRTLQQWIMQHKPDETAITTAETEKATIQLRELMNCREKPRKAKRKPKNNIEI